MALNRHQIIACMTKLYPFYRGRGRFVLSSFIASSSMASRETHLVVLKSGERVFVSYSDYIGRMVYYFGDLDPLITNFIRANVQTGNTVLDVGANIGVVTLPAARWVGHSGRVIAFEPNPSAVSLLKRSVARNGFHNVTVHEVGLSDEDRAAVLRVPPGHAGCASVRDSGEGVQCRLVPLDALELGHGCETVRLMKIDVEGHELKVLRGAANFFDRAPPELVLFESHASKGPFWARDEVRFLADLGYGIHALHRGPGRRPRLLSPSGDGTLSVGTNDFVAVRPGIRWSEGAR